MMSFISLYGTSEHSIGWLTILLDACIKSVIVLALAAGLNLAQFRGVSPPRMVTGGCELPLPTRHLRNLAKLAITNWSSGGSLG